MKKNYNNPFEALFEKKEADYLVQIADKDIEIRKQQEEIEEYKAFMLSLQLSVGDEIKLEELLAKHNKGE